MPLQRRYAESILGGVHILFVVIALTGAKPAPEPRAEYQQGIFYGHIESIAPDYGRIMIRAIEPKKNRREFYLDNRSLFKSPSKKKIGVRKLKVGEKVAVRYFGDSSLVVVDALFVVEGDFKPRDYRVVRAASKKSAAPAKGGH